MTSSVLYSSAVSRLRRPFLCDRFFFLTVRLLKRRSEWRDADFHFLALAFRRARVLHPFFLTAWVFLPDHWHMHLNPVKAGLVPRSGDWRWSSVNEYSGVSAAKQERRCGLTIDRVNMPC